MGKKYLDTKKNTLEASILDVWKEAAKLNEYKTKLLGGLETLELFSPKSEGTDGVPEPSATPPESLTEEGT